MMNKISTNSQMPQWMSGKMITINIEGMHCSSCALLIEKWLKKVPGVEQANVNFASAQANIKVNCDVKEGELIKAVKDAGYHWELKDDKMKNNESEKRQKETKYWFHKFIISAILSLPMIGLMMWDFFPGQLPRGQTIMPRMAIVSLALTVPILFVIWGDFFKGAWSALRMRTFNMYSLIAIGTGVAFLYSLYNFGLYFYQTGSRLGLNGESIPNIYFEVASLLITFVSLWKFLEAKAKGSTSQAIEKLMGLTPKIAHVKRWDEFEDIAIEEIVKWDIILIKPGEKIPTDGIVVKWRSSVDESMLTWESIPVEKDKWDKVFGWTINKLWSLEFEVNKTGDETALGQIIRLIQEAQGSKAPIQGFADKISWIFVPSVILIAVAVFLIWFFVIWSDFTSALLYFSAVIVIACPCALWLATPTALMVGTGKWAEKWILIKWGEPLEMLCKIDTIIFDKTGTITEGKPEVTDIIALGSSPLSEWLLLEICASLEAKSEHPLAEAILNYWKAKKIWLKDVSEFQAIAWKGVKWEIEGQIYLLWTRKLLDENKISLQNDEEIEKLEAEGKTVMLLADEKDLIGIIAAADRIKITSIEAIKRLKESWIEVYMITWDNERTAKAIASQVGIEKVFAQVLPEHKAEKVKLLQAEWHKVAMVWDGINDSPALMQANVGIAMWWWTDVAMEAGSVIIMRDDLNDVMTAINLSKETVGKIKQNMFFALFYNVLGIPIAGWAFASFGFVLKPEFAGLAMAMSSVSVVINSLLLKFFKPDRKNRLSLFAPVIMTIVFLTFFWNFAQIGNSGNWNFRSNEANISFKSDVKDFYVNGENKIWFTPGGVAKLFMESDEILKWLVIAEWTDVFNEGEAQMIIGFAEAQMMKEEWLIKKAWDSLSDFFWLETVKIVWILAPTNTLLDETHLLNLKGFDGLSIQTSLLIKSNNSGDLKLFYLYDEWDIPLKLQSIISTGKDNYSIYWKVYSAMYVGYDEAQMMKKEKLIKENGDTLNDLFGNDVMIAGIMKKTYTLLDMMHFVPESEWKI